ncbi:MAG: hypothetical protein JRJ08_04085 [Deltaproteobacteria bacterium]|nr:hypothetical protein [Deltaproteobacteria bacterium]
MAPKNGAIAQDEERSFEPNLANSQPQAIKRIEQTQNNALLILGVFCSRDYCFI